jgi:uncharacterized protein YecE (DUF72 family)
MRNRSWRRLSVADQSFAVEFRHDSWLREETFTLLAEHHVAYTIVDEPLVSAFFEGSSMSIPTRYSDDTAQSAWQAECQSGWIVL